jgi:aspartyl-tRNA(Asn)/glutamyl-tRNA(Gln) amidotransferase subunit C
VSQPGGQFIDRATVDHVAELAKLGLSEKERERLRHELSAILEYMQVLRDLDAASVGPVGSPGQLANVLRADVVRPSWPREEILAGAPQSEAGQFRVRAILP